MLYQCIMVNTKYRVLALLVLSPIFGELVSGSSPPLEFFNPFSLALFIGLYGCGALLIRELWVRWGRGLNRLILMGAAYGIIEEGLMVRSFFDPYWHDLDILGVYGRFSGVNWIWSLQLTIFHAIYSIIIPIVLVEVWSGSKEPWISEGNLLLVFAVFWISVSLGPFVNSYYPPLSYLIITIIVILMLFVAAWKLNFSHGYLRPPSNRKMFILGLFLGAGWAATFWVFPYLGIPPVVTFLFGILCFIAVARFLSKICFSRMSLLSLSGGILAVFMAIDPIFEFTSGGEAFGMSVVAVALATGLLILRQKISREEVRLDNEAQQHNLAS